MRLSLNITNYSWPGGPESLGSDLVGVVRAADTGEIDTVWVADHLLQTDPTAVPESEMLEAYTALGFLAAQTERVRLGTMVSAVTFRAPSLLIREVTTLDVLSGGRAWLGLGAGYHEDEARAMGLSLPPVAERFEMLEETLELALRMWEDDRSPFGVAISGLSCRSAIPARSPARTRRSWSAAPASARRCDWWPATPTPATCSTSPTAAVRSGTSSLSRHCEEVGRPFEAIEKTVSTRLNSDETGTAFAKRCAALAELGLDHAVVITPGPWTEERVEVLAAAGEQLR